MDEKIGSAKVYRERANELRAEAGKTKDPETRKTMLDIAANYEQLANRVDKDRDPR